MNNNFNDDNDLVLLPITKPLRYRFYAFFIDYVVIWGLFFLLSWLSPFNKLVETKIDPIYQLVIIVPLFACYYTIGNRFGQTLGKRFFRIHLVNKNGDSLQWRRAFVRALFFSMFINIWMATLLMGEFDTQMMIVFILLNVLLVNMIYGLTFNLENQQMVHDRFVQSYVIDADLELANSQLNLIHKGVYFSSSFLTWLTRDLRLDFSHH